MCLRDTATLKYRDFYLADKRGGEVYARVEYRFVPILFVCFYLVLFAYSLVFRGGSMKFCLYEEDSWTVDRVEYAEFLF